MIEFKFTVLLSLNETDRRLFSKISETQIILRSIYYKNTLKITTLLICLSCVGLMVCAQKVNEPENTRC
jgi:hypothetical protein